MTRAERENEAFEKARKLLPEVYKKYPSGGPFHIVIDDGNVETHNIVWCLAHIAEDSLPEEDLDMFIDLAEYLLDMPENKRCKVLAAVAQA